ncbi:hypothetical protein JX266_011429 [Neoarthrinium moseri]|nr:hypothetical protein JX266_011429 [Neoarthrinium moseri]
MFAHPAAPLNLILLAQALVGVAQSTRQCYDPAGYRFDDIPCSNDTSQHSLCCGPGWTCLDNKVCRYTGTTQPALVYNTLVRGTCTDETFQSDACPQFCLAGDANKNGNFIQNCNNGTGCCMIGGAACSCLPGAPDALDFGTTNILQSQSVIPLVEKDVSSSASPSTTSTTSAATSPSTLVADPVNTSVSSSPSQPGGLSVGAVAGISVAIGLVAIVAAGFSIRYCLLRRRRDSKDGKPLAENGSWIGGSDHKPFMQQTWKSEADGESWVRELPAERRLGELSGESRLVEVPATNARRAELE